MARTPYREPKDPRGGHIRVYWDTFDSVPWACLSSSAQLAYLALMRQKNKTNNGDISLPITFARRYGISSTSTLAKALRELVALGFVAVTRTGGATKDGQRLVSLYRFTDFEVLAVPAKNIEPMRPTNDWRAITSESQAREKVAAAEVAAAEAEAARKTKRLLRNSKPTSSKNEAVEPKTSSKFEAWASRPVRNPKHGKEVENVANPMPMRVAA